MRRFSGVVLCLLVLNGIFSGFTAVAAEESPSSSELDVKSRDGSPLAFGLDVQYLPSRFPNYNWGNGAQTDKLGQGVRVAWEWLPLVSRYGKAGIGLGVGYAKVSGAVFAEGAPELWVETIPVDLSVNYRLDFYKDQPIVPFLKAGREKQFVRQKPGTGQRQYDGLMYGGGIAILLDAVDSRSAQSLDNSIGINNTYLTAEYLKSSMTGNANEVDMSRDEFRLGLRFEM